MNHAKNIEKHKEAIDSLMEQARQEEQNRPFRGLIRTLFFFTLYAFIVTMMILLLIQAVFGADMTDSASYLDSELPVNGSFSEPFSLPENNTIYFILLSKSPHLFLSFPGEVYLNKTNTTEIDFNYSIEYYAPLKNETLNATIKLINTYNTKTFIYQMLFNITRTWELYNESTHFDWYISGGDVTYNITTNFLPANGTIPYRIQGKAGEHLNISCTGWLRCPRNATFKENGWADFNVKFTVPLNTTVGFYTDYLYVNASNYTRSRKVDFVILEPGMTFKSYVYAEECFKDFESLKKCQMEAQEFDVKRLADVFAQAKELAYEECKAEQETEYIYYGNIEDNVREDYDKCREDRDDCLDERADYLKNWKSCEQKLVTNESRLMISTYNRVQEEKQRADDALVEAEEMIRGDRARRAFWFWFIVVLIALSGLIFWIIYLRKKYKWGASYG